MIQAPDGFWMPNHWKKFLAQPGTDAGTLIQ